MRRLALAVCAVVLSACPDKKAVQEPGVQSQPRPAGAGAGVDVALDGGVFTLTADKLDRYIRYQDQALPLQAKLLAELARVDVRGDAGMAGAPDAGRAPPAVVKVVRQQAEALERLREELGLTAAEVREIEQLVGDVIAQRVLAPAQKDESLKQMKELGARLPEEEREQFYATLGALETQQQQSAGLAEQRRRWGDANVDLVLTREKDLLRQWEEALATWARSP